MTAPTAMISTAQAGSESPNPSQSMLTSHTVMLAIVATVTQPK